MDVLDDEWRGHLNLNQVFTNNTGNTGTLNLEIAVPLKYLENFWNAFNQF